MLKMIMISWIVVEVTQVSGYDHETEGPFFTVEESKIIKAYKKIQHDSHSNVRTLQVSIFFFHNCQFWEMSCKKLFLSNVLHFLIHFLQMHSYYKNKALFIIIKLY